MESKAKVFVVEDDSFLKDILGQRLSEQAYDLLYASDADTAIETIIREKPDIILLDILLPGERNGFDVLQTVRGSADTKDIPVIILSNLGQQEDKDKAKELGANDFLVKSDSPIDEVIEKIQKYLPAS